MIRIALEMLSVNIRKAKSLIISLASMITMSVIMIDFMENPNMQIEFLFISEESTELNIVYFLLIVLCVLLVSYSCQYYIRVNSREFAIVRLAGFNSFDLLKYMTIQSIIIILISSLISIFLAIILIPLVHYIIYTAFSINYSIFSVSNKVFLQTFMIILLTAVLIVFIELYFINQIKIPEMIENHNIVAYKTKRGAIKIPSAIFLILYLLGLAIICYSDTIIFGTSITLCVGAIGAYGIFYYIIPNYLQKRIDKKRLKPFNYIINGNIALFLQQSKIIISLIMLTAIVIPILIFNTEENSIYYLQLHIIFILINIVCCMTLYNKFNVDFSGKKELYKNLYKLGLTFSDIKNVVIKEVLFIFVLFWIITGLYLLGISIKSIACDKNLFNIVILLEYILPTTICLMLILQQRKKEILQWKK